MSLDPEPAPPAALFRRFVALGDSTTEGLEDPYPDGRGYRGWADRFAEHLAQLEPELRYANLAVRGKIARQVRAEQLDAALALEPDLASVLAGLNDALRRQFDPNGVAEDLEAMVGALRDAGAAVLVFTLPDPVPVNPISRPAARRLMIINEAIREIAARHDAYLVDLWRLPGASDPRLWDLDRLHANPDGHERLAAAAAEAIGLPDVAAGWNELLAPPPGTPWHAAVAREAAWLRRHFAPWLVRHLRGRSSGDGRTAKRPELEPVLLEPVLPAGD